MRDPQKQRDAKRRWYEAHKDVYLERNKRRRAQARGLYQAAKDGPCSDCGISYPYFVMDLDHLDPNAKVDSISRLVFQRNPGQVEDEIAKCEVVCSNCHRFRTARRAGIYVPTIP